MISKVKGKTEISPNLPRVLRWFCFSSFQNPNLFKSFPVVRRSLRPDIYFRFYFKEVKQVGSKTFHQLGRQILYEKY